MPTNFTAHSGKVYLIGAGPGDPGLLTLRARDILEQVDVILYDYLVNPVALRHAGAHTEVISLGRHEKGVACRIWSQEEINAKLIEFARQGKSVARLKSGDPLIFGRITEELTALRDAGIPYEVVPGVTAALAAGAFTGIPVTHRDLASAVAFITGQETKEKTDSKIDFEALARFPGTLVFYMGVTTVKNWAPKLIEAGKVSSTPVAIIRRCSFPDQLTITTTLGEVAEVLTPSDKIRPPVIVIVGEVVKLRESLSWFESRPLFGKTVLVTRPEEADGELTRLLEERGAEVIQHPVIQIGPAPDLAPLDAAIEKMRLAASRPAMITSYWLLFSSANGVNAFFKRLGELGYDSRSLAGVKIACVGPSTAAALSAHGLRCDVMPETDFSAEGLLAALRPQWAGEPILSIRASRGRNTLVDGVRSWKGANDNPIEEVVAYASTDVTQVDPVILDRMEQGEIDYVLVTSSAIARSTIHLFGPALQKTKIASLSPLTSQALVEAGHPPHCEAQEATLLSLIEAISGDDGSGVKP